MTKYQLYNKGYSDKEIGVALNLERNTVAGWRLRMGLPCNKKRYRPTAKESQLVVGMIADLIYLSDKAKRIPDQDGIMRFISVWRACELTSEGGALCDLC